MRIHGKGTGAWIVRAMVLVAFAATFQTACSYPPPEVATLPVRTEVEGPPYLRVVVTDWQKRPLTAGEMSPMERAGFRWDYTVQITDTEGKTVQFREVTASVTSLTGFRSTRTIPLQSRVDPHGTVPITINAHLSTSNPDEPGNLTGVQQLTFLGRDDEYRLVQLVVRVPLN
jgi:hypothetical protein